MEHIRHILIHAICDSRKGNWKVFVGKINRPLRLQRAGILMGQGLGVSRHSSDDYIGPVVVRHLGVFNSTAFTQLLHDFQGKRPIGDTILCFQQFEQLRQVKGLFHGQNTLPNDCPRSQIGFVFHIDSPFPRKRCILKESYLSSGAGNEPDCAAYASRFNISRSLLLQKVAVWVYVEYRTRWYAAALFDATALFLRIKILLSVRWHQYINFKIQAKF